MKTYRWWTCTFYIFRGPEKGSVGGTMLLLSKWNEQWSEQCRAGPDEHSEERLLYAVAI